MKQFLITLFFFSFLFLASGQNNVVKTVGVSYTAGAPTFSPGKYGSQVAIDTVTGLWYEHNGTSWSASGYRIQTISGCAAPAYTPAKYQSRFVINACTAGQGGPEVYYWNGSAWLQINEGQTYTAGTGISIGSGIITNTSLNIGSADQTLTGNRSVTMGSNSLTFSGPLKVGGTMNVGHGNGNLSTSVAVGDSTIEAATIGANVAVGGSAMKRAVETGGNVAVGYYAFNNLLRPGSDFPLTTSNFGTAVGYYAAAKMKYSFDVTAMGYAAMRSCDSCNFSTAIGYSSLANSYRSTGMTALGWASAANVRYGDVGTFIGYSAGRYAKSSLEDVVVGYEAMEGGSGALDTMIAQGNTISGYRSGRAAQNYLRNTLYGWRSADGLTNGQWNTVIGANAAGTTALFDRCVVIGANVPISSGAYGQILIGNGSGDIKFKSDAGRVTLYDPLTFNSYGSGTNTGTAAYTLAVTSGGNIIETTVATAVSEPANQVVYGTGTGVDSDAGFTYNASTNRLSTNGYLEIGSSPDARIVLSNNDRVIAMDGTYGYLYAPNNQAGVLCGLTATDPANYYRNGQHKFQTTAGANFAVIGASGMSVNNGPTVRGALDIVGFGTTSATYSLLVNNSAANDAFCVKDDGSSGFGLTNPSARVHLAGGSTTRPPFKISSGTNLTTPQDGAIEYNGTELTVTNTAAEAAGRRENLSRNLKGSATLDFSSTLAAASGDLTITVTGAAVGDAVTIGLPASPDANSCFTAWVSATNTVTVRFNNYSASPIDPASATYNVIVTKY